MKKLFLLFVPVLLLVSCSIFLSACGEGNTCSHTFTGEWFTDATHHWQPCSLCGEKGLNEEHRYNQENAIDEYVKTPATTTSKAVYYKSCVCGVKGTDTFESGKLLGEIANPEMSSDTIIYGDDYSVDYNAEGDITVEYKHKGEDDSMYSETKPVNVGEYTVRISLAETNNHTGSIQTLDFEIKPRKLENLQTTVEYNGQSFHEIDLSQIEDGLTLHVMFDSANVGATATGVFVYLNGMDTFNYEVVTSGANACRVEIVAKELELTWIAPWSLAFKNDGYDFVPEVQFNNLEINDECRAIIELNSGDNYWYDSTFTFRITGLEGANADNYKLPTQNLVSPEYSITCDAETGLHQQIELQDLEAYDGSVDTQKNYIAKIHIENGADFKFKYALQSKGALYSIRILEKGIKGDDGFVRSVQITTGHESTGEYSDTFTLTKGDYYLEIVKYESEAISGKDTVELCYSYES